LTEKVHERSGTVNYLFKTQAGPTVPERCPECNSTLHVSDFFDLDSCINEILSSFPPQMAGPMWSDSIHDKEFVTKVLEHLEENQDKYGTCTRMKGMLTVAKEVGIRHLPLPSDPSIRSWFVT
jgi:tRNA (guanine26-N2/guanine27-N2)-dimethyltransferase